MTHRQHRLLQRTALAVVGVLMLTTSGAYAAYRYYTGRITSIDVSSLGQAGGPTSPSQYWSRTPRLAAISSSSLLNSSSCSFRAR